MRNPRVLEEILGVALVFVMIGALLGGLASIGSGILSPIDVCANPSYNVASAVNYAETWWNSRNPIYRDYTEEGGDCANFVSQCLIAGGLDLSPGVVDDRGCIISCSNLHNFLVNNVGATWETRSKDQTEPIWFVPGDPAIFRYNGQTEHAVFAVTGDAAHYCTCNAHSNDRYHKTIQWFFDNSNWNSCTYYHIPSLTTLTTSVVPTNGGSVSPNPPGGSYDPGTQVTLTASANQNSGYRFVHWGGPATSGWSEAQCQQNPVTITMDGNKEISANFENLTLTVTSPNGAELWDIGKTYNITWSVSGNTANIYYFTIVYSTDGGTNWNTIGAGAVPAPDRSYSWTIPDTPSTQCRVRVRAIDPDTWILDYDISNANFTIRQSPTPKYTLTLIANPTAGGTVTANPVMPAGGYDAGTVVTVTAYANAGYTFANWSGDLTGNTNPATITMNSNKNITGNFQPPITKFTLTLTANPTAGGAVTANPVMPAGGYDVGTGVTLTATANTGYIFTDWSGDLAGNTNPTTVPMNSNKNITANFTVTTIKYTLTVSANPAAGGTVSLNPTQPAGGYASGTVVALTATTNNGYTFCGWSGDLTGNSNPASITMNSNKNITANFTTITTKFTLTLTANPTAGGAVTANPVMPAGGYDVGTGVTLTATANTGYIFTDWSGDLTGNTNPTTITMNSNKYVTGNFQPQAVIMLSPASGSAGTIVTITGSGFAPNADGSIWFDNNNNDVLDEVEPQCGLTTTSTGNIPSGIYLWIPDIPVGNYQVRADLPAGGAVEASAPFTLNSTGIFLSPPTGIVDTIMPIRVRGIGFTPNTNGTVWFDGNGNGVLDVGESQVSVNATTDGIIGGATLIIPAVSAGSYLVKADVPAGGANEAATTFIINSRGIFLNPNEGVPGTVINISGAGFTPNTPGVVWFDSDDNRIPDDSEPVLLLTTDTTGKFLPGITLKVPSTVETGRIYGVWADIPVGIPGELGYFSVPVEGPYGRTGRGYFPVGFFELSLQPPLNSVVTGQTFDLTIQARGIGPVSNVKAFLNFNPSKLAVLDADITAPGVQIIPSSSLPTISSNSVNNSTGTIDFIAGKQSEPLPTGTFTIATIRFLALADTSPITSISYSSTGSRKTTIESGGNDKTGYLGYALATIKANAPSQQPQFKAPWAGTAKISQGNNSPQVAPYSHYNHISEGWENIYAIDIALEIGTDVLAPADGVVWDTIFEYPETEPSGGIELIIQHTGPTGAKFYTIYLHLKEILIGKGSSVQQGQVIAKSGNTGKVDAHLHFHLWNENGKYDSHTKPIERLIMKQVGVDSDFREYDARLGELNNSKIENKLFVSNNVAINHAPIAQFVYSPHGHTEYLERDPAEGENITFNATYLDQDGDNLTFIWAFEEGKVATGNPVTYAYARKGTYTVTLSVLDEHGAMASASTEVKVVPQWRKLIHPGDLLLSRTDSPFGRMLGGFEFWTHVGIYVGDGRVIEALKTGGVQYTDIISWDYATKTCVELRGVNASDQAKSEVVDFVRHQEHEPYNLFHVWKPGPPDYEEDQWYCSELAWAAYMRQGVDIDRTPDEYYVTPQDVSDDNDTYLIDSHMEYIPKINELMGGNLDILLMSPADIIVTDPNGLVVSKELCSIPGAAYVLDDFDYDGNFEDIVSISDAKTGDYVIRVIPHLGASPTDTYSLKTVNNRETIVLAQNVQIKDIPEQGYTFLHNRLEGDVNNDGNINSGDALLVAKHIVGTRNLTGGDFLAADVNDDNFVNGADLLLIKKFTVGTIVQFPGGVYIP